MLQWKIDAHSLHSMEKQEIISHQKNISWNQLWVTSLVRRCFHEIFIKKVRGRISVISTLWCDNYVCTEIFSHTFLIKISWKQRTIY